MCTNQLDAIVVGSGFAGIYACYTLKTLGLNFACIDNAGDVGGTWYWNKYPGAMSDTHSHVYRFSWDEEHYHSQAQDWVKNYAFQPEIEQYLRSVVERHDLRKHMQFDRELESAVFNEESHTWTITTRNTIEPNSPKTVFQVRYFIGAMGLLSQPIWPDIKGLSDFQGPIIHSSRWRNDIDLKGKRVAVIGSGSTGIQIFSKIASEVGSVTCFIRHPQYVVPAGLRDFTDEERDSFSKRSEQLWRECRNTALASDFPEATRSFHKVSAEEREAIFEQLWRQGNGIRFMMGGLIDVTTNIEANNYVTEFIRRKIRATVKDPEKARVLIPNDYYARRPVCAIDYYEQFNRENVHVVDLQKSPISSVTRHGIATSIQNGVIAESHHDFDIIILATGFDALDGNYTRIQIQGRQGHTIQEHWADTITSFGGFAVAGFPNMFMVLGPQSPFANNIMAIEAQIAYIRTLIEKSEHLRRSEDKIGVVEVATETEASWAATCEKAVEGSLFKKTSSWIFGANVPGKVIATRFFFPGLKAYREAVDGVMGEDCKGFKFT